MLPADDGLVKPLRNKTSHSVIGRGRSPYEGAQVPKIIDSSNVSSFAQSNRSRLTATTSQIDSSLNKRPEPRLTTAFFAVFDISGGLGLLSWK
jgi:hypothetical protein